MVTMVEDDYGFFCDLETANTMEYDKVEYYIVTTRTHYEVRRKWVSNRIVKMQPQPQPEIQSADDLSYDKMMSTKISNTSFIQTLSHLPQDIYYSLVVCCTTASCVYLIMTCS